MTGTGTLSGSEVVAGIMAAFSVDVDVVWEVLVRFGSGDVIGDLRSWVLDCGGGVDIGLCFEVSVDGGMGWKLKWFGWGDALMQRVFCRAVTRWAV